MRALLVVAFAAFASPLLAQVPADAGRVVVDVQVGDSDTGFLDEEECTAACCPPSTSKKLLMGAGSVAAFLVLFFMLVRLVERVFIRQERSPLLGRHLGISCALFFGAAITAGILYGVTGCWLATYTYLLAVIGGVWVLHFIYTMLAVRK